MYLGPITKYVKEVEAKYSSGEKKITEPLRNIGNLLYTIISSDTVTRVKTTGNNDSDIEKTMYKHLGKQEVPTQAPETPQAGKEPQQSTTPYKQVVNLISKLNKTQKQKLLKTLSPV